MHRRVKVAHTKLCASRAFMPTTFPLQSHEMLFDAHTRAFRARFAKIHRLAAQIHRPGVGAGTQSCATL
jgi:hypothetical protein